jgi:CheY-like chemotaxis protein/predicted RNA-binding protein with TRAM domain
MKILVLEDNTEKLDSIIQVLNDSVDNIELRLCSDFQCFFKSLERDDFDLIVVDLVVPRFGFDRDPENLTMEIIDAARDHNCRNFRVPIVALTQFDEAAESGFKELNQKDISVVTFSYDNDAWKTSLEDKVKKCTPFKTYDFVIVCALAKEVDGFIETGHNVGAVQAVHGLECREINIGTNSGVIVCPPRMGLVSCAITTSRAIDLFSPRTVCMSGICAGISGKANIYDVVIPESCHQHDFGKWSVDGFVPEVNSVQIDHHVRLRIQEVLQDPAFKALVLKDIRPAKSEIPPEKEFLDCNVFLAPASSGSAVVADAAMTDIIKEGLINA